MRDTVSKATVSYERIQEVLDTVSRVRDLPRARRAPQFKGKIEFDNVTFQLQCRPADPERHQFPDRAGTGGGVRGSQRRGQIHHRQPDSALLRSHFRAR